MDQLGQVIVGVMGGGLVALIPVIVKAFRSMQQGRLAKEGSAISRWKEYSEYQTRQAEAAWRMVTAFRKWYHKLWAQYVRATGDDTTFPADPVTHEKKLREGDDDEYDGKRDKPPETK